MKQFLVFVRKEFRHIFRDRRTMLLLLGMPVVQILLFGFALTNEVKDTAVAVFDPSKDYATRQIKERFEASAYFTLREELTDADRIDKVFHDGKTGLVIVFSQHFADDLMQGGEAAVQLLTDGTDPNQAVMITGYASGILADYAADLVRRQGGGTYLIKPVVRSLYNPQAKSSYNFVPGVMGMILMLICAMMTSISIVREKETGTMEVLLVSPMRPIYILLSKAVPYMVLSALNLATILLLSVFVLGVPVAGNLLLLLGISLLFIFLALSLGLLISNMVSSQMAAMLASGMGLMMPVMLLSGLIFPIESMPRILQYISTLVPARWYIDAVRRIMIQGVELRFVAKDILILVVMTAVLLTVSLKRFKTRLS
ncbi:MAG: ABC transporter permease [Prevotellaceae bacterium]|nr:ABC transporter permease [Prevotellaceae bacterium]